MLQPQDEESGSLLQNESIQDQDAPVKRKGTAQQTPEDVSKSAKRHKSVSALRLDARPSNETPGAPRHDAQFTPKELAESSVSNLSSPKAVQSRSRENSGSLAGSAPPKSAKRDPVPANVNEGQAEASTSARRLSPALYRARGSEAFTQAQDLLKMDVQERRKTYRERREGLSAPLALQNKLSGWSSLAHVEVAGKIGGGTFGEVNLALLKNKDSRLPGIKTALKKIVFHSEDAGVPITTVREIKILKRIASKWVIELLDMVTNMTPSFRPKMDPNTSAKHFEFHMAFPLAEHDMCGLVARQKHLFDESIIKCFAMQIFMGCEFLARNKLLHRDIKSANLLVTKENEIKFADFGLTRSYTPSVPKNDMTKFYRIRQFTGSVVTRWYRPPELLLGAKTYGPEIDTWGAACVIAEMFRGSPILQGTADLDQLLRTFQLCGSPTPESWPGYDELPNAELTRFPERYARVVYEEFHPYGKVPGLFANLMDKLLTLDPARRLTAREAMLHEWFWTDPLPCEPNQIPAFPTSKEINKHESRNANRPQTLLNTTHKIIRDATTALNKSTTARRDQEAPLRRSPPASRWNNSKDPRSSMANSRRSRSPVRRYDRTRVNPSDLEEGEIA